MSGFTREFAMRLAEKLQTEGYRLFVVLGLRDDEEEIDVTVVGGGQPQDVDDLEDVLAQLIDELRSNIAFQTPVGSA